MKGVGMYESLVDTAKEKGANDARTIATDKIVFDDRSYLKCRFGCNRWGKFWTCPPNLGMTPEAFMKAFSNYRHALVIQSSDPKASQEATLEVEKDAMLNHNMIYAFAMVLCVLCEECAFPEPCRYPHLSRPSMDAFGIDIPKTVEQLGFDVPFDKDGKLLPAWYSIVLLE